MNTSQIIFIISVLTFSSSWGLFYLKKHPKESINQLICFLKSKTKSILYFLLLLCASCVYVAIILKMKIAIKAVLALATYITLIYLIDVFYQRVLKIEPVNHLKRKKYWMASFIGIILSGLWMYIYHHQSSYLEVSSVAFCTFVPTLYFLRLDNELSLFELDLTKLYQSLLQTSKDDLLKIKVSSLIIVMEALVISILICCILSSTFQHYLWITSQGILLGIIFYILSYYGFIIYPVKKKEKINQQKQEKKEAEVEAMASEIDDIIQLMVLYNK